MIMDHKIKRKHSSRMHNNRVVTRPSSESVSMRPIVDRRMPVKTLPSLAVGNNYVTSICVTAAVSGTEYSGK